ncbi:uncharacterized protein BDV17DRAFT_294420 [Aspergillus undulatus]|uniref:uncharacterized protein n=1 Tax=Aspergillus undulatus TaxID=1810928 RepID=UPI003CCDE175
MTRFYLAALGLLALATAQECRLESSVNEVASQDELDEISRNCTTIIGSLGILPAYSGSVALNNVVNITSSNRMQSNTYPGDDLSFNIPSIELPDFEHVGDSISLSGVAINGLSVPRLQSVNQSIYVFLRDNAGVEFPSLTAAGSVHFNGNMTDVTLDALERAENITIQNIGSPGRPTSDPPLLDLSLLALENASSLWVEGSVRRHGPHSSAPRLSLSHLREFYNSHYTAGGFSVPELTTLTGEPRLPRWPSLTLRFSQQSDPIPVRVPKLASVEGGVSIYGYMSLFFSALRTITGNFTASTHDEKPTAIELPLETVDTLMLYGPLENIFLPNLRNFTQVDVNSDRVLDCEDFMETLRETAGDEAGGIVCGSSTGLGSSFSLNGGTLALASALATGLMGFLF